MRLKFQRSGKQCCNCRIMLLISRYILTEIRQGNFKARVRGHYWSPLAKYIAYQQKFTNSKTVKTVFDCYIVKDSYGNRKLFR